MRKNTFLIFYFVLKRKNIEIELEGHVGKIKMEFYVEFSENI